MDALMKIVGAFCGLYLITGLLYYVYLVISFAWGMRRGEWARDWLLVYLLLFPAAVFCWPKWIFK